ncbi:MAG TPA: condensation domain-containing protein, partial [Ruminiclostridium sp.]|nr:condensation domain-containing protein [Ruminiclostridium sp.]
SIFLRIVIYDRYGNERLKVGVVASFVFDMSVQQIYPSLLLGHELNILPGDLMKNGSNLFDFLRDLDVSDGTPVILDMVNMYQQKNSNQILGLRHFIVGGEALAYSAAKEFILRNSNSVITNIYGPTECTVEATTYFFDRKVMANTDEMLIGKSVLNSRIYILDEDKRILPVNTVGEIYIAGDCVGAGYINNEELTKDRFLPDILDNSRFMYKTGDLGEWSIDGNIKFHGRNDSQVKVNGFRIELGEIEVTLEKLEYIKKAKVIAADDDSGRFRSKVISAYILVISNTITSDKIVSDLQMFLPSYMIPKYFVVVDYFPMNINGKIDLKMLPSFKENALKGVVDGASGLEGEYDERIISVVKKYFDLQAMSTENSILTESGDSLQLLMFISEVEQVFSIKFSNDEINIYMSLSQILEILKSKINEKGNIGKAKSKHNRKKFIMATPGQQYVMEVAHKILVMGENRKLNQMIFFVPLLGQIDFDRLKKAYIEVLNGSSVFRLRCMHGETGSRFYEENIFSFESQIVEHIKVDSNDYKTLLNYLSDFDLTDFPLVEMKIFENNNSYVMALNVHHVIFDYFSFYLFMKRLEEAYFSVEYIQKESQKENDFMEYMVNVRQEMFTNQEEHVFWKNYLVDSKVPEIKGYKGDSASYGFSEIIEKLDDEKVNKLRLRCKEQNMNEFYIILTAFIMSIESLCEEDRFRLFTFDSGRKLGENYSTMGFFTNVIPYINIRGTNNFYDKIKEVSEGFYMIKEHLNNYDFTKVTEGLFDGDKCLKDVLFDYQKYYNISKNDNQLWDKAYLMEELNIKDAIIFKIFDYRDEVELFVQYNNNLYGENDIKNLVEKFNEILNINL